MTEGPVLRALGLMSGTSMDGIDAALISTDGVRVEETGASLTFPYDPEFRSRLQECLGQENPPGNLVRELTLLHAAAVRALLAETGSEIDLIGFHGHTILHRPDIGETLQIGDGALLARETGCPVVCDFRSADVHMGGEGAPLAPLYHDALSRRLEKPLAVLNIGGVANVTWIGEDGILAFDTGPGNALLDDWCAKTVGCPMDKGGELARDGSPDPTKMKQLLDNSYFDRTPPKSLDRNDFTESGLEGMSAADGAATLTALTAEAVALARSHFPIPAKRWLITGGGRKNQTLMKQLEERLKVPVQPVEDVGWDGDALEAQAFGFLAVRSRYGLPLSLPTTTGVSRASAGGVFCDVQAKEP